MPSINNKALSAEERKKRAKKWAQMEVQRRDGSGPHHENVRVITDPGPVRVMDEHVQGGIAVRVIPGPDPNVAPQNYPDHQGGAAPVEGELVPNSAQVAAPPFSTTKVSRPVRSTMAPAQGVPAMGPGVPNVTRHVGSPVQQSPSNVTTHESQEQIAQPVPNAAQQGFEVNQVETPAHLNSPEVDLGVVLSAHMRPGLTQLQVNSLIEQTVRPKLFLVWVSPGVPVDDFAISAFPQMRSNMDWGPWARWGFGVDQLGTEFVAVLDDDAVLQPGWLQAALEHLKENSRDVVVAQGNYLQGADPVIENTDQVPNLVDLGAKAWVFRPEIFQDPGPWRQHPTGWDIHMAWSAAQADGHTVVLPGNALVENIETSPGLRSLPDIDKVRELMIEEASENGWTQLGPETDD